MRAITKGAEPASLTRHRLTANCDYDNYADKDALRAALHAEQQGLCCYCMGRIRVGADAMKIEHWQCQAAFPDQQLVYRNLLGACLGGMGQPRDKQYCDSHKGNLNIRFNPAELQHHIEARVWFGADGSINSDNAEFDGQLTAVLNLNLEWLKNNRKGVLDALLEWWHRSKPLPADRIQREIQRMTSGGQLQPYCQVAVWWLRKKLEVRA